MSTMFEQAVAFAARAHAGQRRKGLLAEPYVEHPKRVAALLREAGITDERVLCAALLHDVLEDTTASSEAIFNEFGPEVRHMVEQVTDSPLVKHLPEVRRRAQVKKAPHLSHGAKLIKLADKIDNLRSLHVDPPVKWSRERIRSYLDWATEVENAIGDINPVLALEFQKAAARLRSKLDPNPPEAHRQRLRERVENLADAMLSSDNPEVHQYGNRLRAALTWANTSLDVDALAQEIRRVDGNHSLGAGALAEALAPYIETLIT